MPRTRRTIPNPARGAAITAMAVLALALSACTGGTPTPTSTPLPTVRISTPTAPTELTATQPQLPSYSVLGPSGSRPALLAAAKQDPGKAAELAVYSSTDGRTWTAGSAPSASGAAVHSVQIAGSEALVAIVASTWSHGTIRPALWTSTDGRRWTSVGLPKPFGPGYEIDGVAVTGSRILVVGTDADGDASGAVRSSSAWHASKLPSAGSDRRLYPQSVAAGTDRAILLARPAAPGSTGPVVAYSSTDGGRTWGAKAASVADASADLSGVVATSGGFVATGSIPASGSAVQRPSAWSSPDGATWTAEPISEPSDPTSKFYETADAALDPPLVGADGQVAAVLDNANSAYSTVWVRGTGWHEVGQTGANSANDEQGYAFTRADGSVSAALGHGGWIRGGGFGPAWSDGTVLASRAPAYVGTRAAVLGSGVVIPADKTVFAVTSTSWTNRVDARVAKVSSGGAVTVATGVPDQAAGLGEVVYGSHGSASVVLGTSWDGVGPILLAGFATSDGKTWTAISGFPGDGRTTPESVAWVDGQWVAVVARAASTIVGTPAHGGVYTSKDGVGWSAASGDFGSAQVQSATTDVCPTPDSSAVAVGWVQRAANQYSPAAWHLEKGTWVQADLGKIGSEDGYLLSCAGDGKSLTVEGQVAGRSSLLSVTAAGVWSTSYAARRGDSIGSVSKVSGGFVASGEHAAGSSDQAVVWLSRTGRSWTPVAIPALGPGSTTDVAPLGKDLVVVMDPALGHPISVVRDIGKVIQDYVT